MARMVVAMSWWAVIIKTGVSEARFFSSGMRSMPEASGKRMSRMMAAGGVSAARRTSSAPVPAESTPKPRSSRCIERSSRIERSSSMMRIESIGVRSRSCERHTDNISSARPLFDARAAPVLAGDAGYHGQPETAAAGPLRREGYEGLVAQLRGQCLAGVGDRDFKPGCELAKGDLDRAAARLFGCNRRLPREDLDVRADPDRIEHDGRHPLRQLAHEGHASLRPLLLHAGHRFFNRSTGIAGYERKRRRPRELQHFVEEQLDVEHLSQGNRGAAQVVLGQGAVTLQRLEGDLDRAQRIAHLMRDQGSEEGQIVAAQARVGLVVARGEIPHQRDDPAVRVAQEQLGVERRAGAKHEPLLGRGNPLAERRQILRRPLAASEERPHRLADKRAYLLTKNRFGGGGGEEDQRLGRGIPGENADVLRGAHRARQLFADLLDLLRFLQTRRSNPPRWTRESVTGRR